jgi:hypothetical protein
VYNRPEEVVEYLSAKFTTEATPLGLQYIGKYDEKMIPKYPAVVVSAGGVTKVIGGTHKYTLEIRTFVWVYHGKATLTYTERSLADLQLATAIVASVEADMTLGGNVVHGYFVDETPGVLQPRATKSDLIVGTRLAHWVMTQKMF